MILLWWACLQGLQDQVERALAEEDPVRRRALTAGLRAFPFAEVELAVRNPRRGPSPHPPGEVVERTLKAAGEEVRWAVHVPKSYTPEKIWPLLVTLHGANLGGNPGAGRDWIQTWLRCGKAREGAVIAAPTTVRHTWASTSSHAAVFELVRVLQRDLRIDADRIHLDGMSMGGGGTFRLAEHRPDRWASIGPRCNVPDVRRKRDGTLVTMSPENLAAIPVYWVVGAKDEKVGIEMARAARDAFAAEKVELVYREFPEGGHDWGLEDDGDVFDWYMLNPRRTWPAEVRFRSWEPAFHRAYWLEILKRSESGPIVMVHLDMQGKESERRTEYRPPATLGARKAGNALTITTAEVKELRVWLGDGLLDLDRPVTIHWNGRKVHDAPVRRSVDVLIEEARRRDDRSMTFAASLDLR